VHESLTTKWTKNNPSDIRATDLVWVEDSKVVELVVNVAATHQKAIILIISKWHLKVRFEISIYNQSSHHPEN
jgi:hypothetical protein